MEKELVKMIGCRYVCYHITGAVCEIGQIVKIGDSKLALDVHGKGFGLFVFVFELSRVISIGVNQLLGRPIRPYNQNCL